MLNNCTYEYTWYPCFHCISFTDLGQSTVVFLTFEPFSKIVWLSALHVHNAHMHISWFKEEGRHTCMSVHLSFFVLLYSANFMNKLIFNENKKYQQLMHWLYVQIFYNWQTHRSEKVHQLSKKKRLIVSLSILLVYDLTQIIIFSLITRVGHRILFCSECSIL